MREEDWSIHFTARGSPLTCPANYSPQEGDLAFEARLSGCRNHPVKDPVLRSRSVLVRVFVEDCDRISIGKSAGSGGGAPPHLSEVLAHIHCAG